jgi:hypothetical protein
LLSCCATARCCGPVREFIEDEQAGASISRTTWDEISAKKRHQMNW